ncbi:MAG: hypothetical protein GX146_12210 [Myxococcales bacterium]|nr:hypothetical protein [Myxococcales bacterium]
MKKNFLWVVAIAVAIAMVGCSDSDKDKNKTEDPTNTPNNNDNNDNNDANADKGDNNVPGDAAVTGTWKYTSEVYDGEDATEAGTVRYQYIDAENNITFRYETVQGSVTAFFEDVGENEVTENRIFFIGDDYKSDVDYERNGSDLTMTGSFIEDGETPIDVTVTAVKVPDVSLEGTWQLIAQVWQGNLEKFPDEDEDGVLMYPYMRFGAKTLSGYTKLITTAGDITVVPEESMPEDTPYEAKDGALSVDFEGLSMHFGDYIISGNLILVRLNPLLVQAMEMPSEMFGAQVPDAEVDDYLK